jgi:NAD(P)-dependent dehydrogenase (short-subunit alcohol dehydrogenase family)
MAKVFAMTGGATGIGKALKDKIEARGDRMIIADLSGGDIDVDLSTTEGRQKAIAGITALAPDGLDGFIACAGLGPHANPKTIIDKVNYFAAVECAEGVKALVSKKEGSVVMVSSNSAPMLEEKPYLDLMSSGNEVGAEAYIEALTNEDKGFNAYGGSKRALALWTRSNAPAYAKLGMRLNAIAPGPTNTAMTAGTAADPVFKDSMEQACAAIPLGVGEPDMIADAMLFLLDDASRFVTGVVLFADGGQDAFIRPNAL